MRIGSMAREAGIGVLALFALSVVACNGEAERPGTDAMDEAHEMRDMPMDREMMERHAREGEAMAAEMRAHVEAMRAMSPDRQYENMDEHARQVSRMLTMMNRHMREMSMGMPMDDEEMGRMMGMSADEHRRMMAEMQTLREELETLQTAPPARVRERMPAHLDRADELVRMMEHGAAHMRRHGHP